VADEQSSPTSLARLSCRKLRYLISSVAQINRGDVVLELFAGSGLGTAVIAERNKHPEKITAVDLHYSLWHGWKYLCEKNFATAVAQMGFKAKGLPTFVGSDATDLPFNTESFDVVLIPDAPRNLECELTPYAQHRLFNKSFQIQNQTQ